MEGAYEVAAETEVLGVRDQLEADVAVVVDMATHGRLIEHGWLNGLGSKLFLGDLWGRKGDEAAGHKGAQDFAAGAVSWPAVGPAPTP